MRALPHRRLPACACAHDYDTVRRRVVPQDANAQLAEEEEWPDDYSPPDGRYSTKWPADWSKDKIAEEARVAVEHYVEDWGWELHKYARLNKPDRVRKVLRYEIHLEAFDGSGKQKEVLNWQDEDFGQCALWWLAMHGRQNLVQLLIDTGCDVNLSDKDGWTPLSVAAFYGHAEVIKALLAAGADPSKEVDDGDTAYDKAVAWDHPECAVLLKGAQGPSAQVPKQDVSTPDPPSLTSLSHARPLLVQASPRYPRRLRACAGGRWFPFGTTRVMTVSASMTPTALSCSVQAPGTHAPAGRAAEKYTRV